MSTSTKLEIDAEYKLDHPIMFGPQNFVSIMTVSNGATGRSPSFNEVKEFRSAKISYASMGVNQGAMFYGLQTGKYVDHINSFNEKVVLADKIAKDIADQTYEGRNRGIFLQRISGLGRTVWVAIIGFMSWYERIELSGVVVEPAEISAETSGAFSGPAVTGKPDSY